MPKRAHHDVVVDPVARGGRNPVASLIVRLSSGSSLRGAGAQHLTKRLSPFVDDTATWPGVPAEVHEHQATIELVGVAVAKPLLVDVSIVVPTRNEFGNIYPLAEAVTAAMMGHDRSWELLFVDDSDDGTGEIIAELSSRCPHIRLLRRPRRERKGGPYGAVVAGLAQARGQSLVVMDADLQHPPDVARELSTLVLRGAADIAVASRYVTGASRAGRDTGRRRLVSRGCAGLVHALVPATRGIRDPMSGFFAVARSRLEGVRLRAHGSGLLMELLSRLPRARVVELPFRTAPGAAGPSNAPDREAIQFLRHVGRLARPSRSSLGDALRWLVLQAPLAGILIIQSLLSIQLIYRNTAFLDEATYLSAGHYLIQSWFHGGGANMHFSAYFSGYPDIYPVLAAMADSVGGLTAARLMSLGFLLTATLCCYASARRLWGRMAGWLAAAVFVSTAGAQFLGALATYDAMSLMLITIAAWIVIRFADGTTTRAAIGLVIPVLILANATKYASAIFDLPVLGLAFFLILDRHGLRVAMRMTAILIAGLAVATALLVGIAGPETLTGIMSTTLSRASGATPAGVVLDQSWNWVGAVACLAALATVVGGVMAWRGRLNWPTVGILAVAAATVLLAPANQARIETLTSLSKHVAFGAWFGALGAGWLLSRVMGLRPRDAWRFRVMGPRPRGAWRFAFAALVLIPLSVVGAAQARQLFAAWPNSTSVVAALRPLVSHQKLPVLMDDADVARYYLEDELSVPHWIDTYSFAYTPPGSGITLVGPAAYAAAVDHGYYGVIALDYSHRLTVDHAVAVAIHASHRYAWVGNFTSYDAFGPATYVVWRLVPPSS